MERLEMQLKDIQLTHEETYLKKKVRNSKIWLGVNLGFLTYDAALGAYDMATGKYGWGAVMLGLGVMMGIFARSNYRDMKDYSAVLAELKKMKESQYSTIDDAVKSEDTEEVLKL